jgi:hypothetical protein
MKRILTLISLAFLTQAQAHPVAYQGALGLMGYHQADMVEWQAMYSVTSRYSLGVDYVWDRMDGPDRQLVLARVNWLPWRANGTDSQANLYLSAGGGALERSGGFEGAALIAAEADYETRHVYFSGKGQAVFAKGAGYELYQLRAGVAPYVGEFEGLNTWAIVQLQYFPQALTDSLRIGPVVRFFYRNVLWEFGVTSRGLWSFNLMFHF